MPIRITPKLSLGPCVLALEDIEKITTLVEADFPGASFSADDKTWQIYGETREPFLKAIVDRDTLDAFGVWAKSTDPNQAKEITILFNQKEATISLAADPKYESWFEHLVNDIKKCVRRPTFSQVAAYLSKERRFDIRFLFLVFPLDLSEAFTAPYCKIVIKQRPPNQFVEGVKVNIVSNIIWAILVFALGIITALVGQRVFGGP
jgi:hypothetical protein